MAPNGPQYGSWELNYRAHWGKYMNSFWRIDDYTFADFIWYLIKNRKIHVFRNPRNNV